MSTTQNKFQKQMILTKLRTVDVPSNCMIRSENQP